MDAPDSSNDFLREHAELLTLSYRRVTGRRLVSGQAPDAPPGRALFEAPYGVVSHDTRDDPVFNYGNRTALSLFEMDWTAFTALPSRLSAEPVNRSERAALLARVSADGFVDGYGGVRISSTGRRFRIEEATVWNVLDENGLYHGQAAVFFRWSEI